MSSLHTTNACKHLCTLNTSLYLSHGLCFVAFKPVLIKEWILVSVIGYSVITYKIV